MPLAAILQEEGHGAAERRTLTSLYADYAKDQPDALAFLEQVLAEEADAGANQYARLALTRRQANAAVALAALGHWEKIWPCCGTPPIRPCAAT